MTHLKYKINISDDRQKYSGELLLISDVANILAVSKSSIRRYVKYGLLHPIKDYVPWPVRAGKVAMIIANIYNLEEVLSLKQKLYPEFSQYE